MIYYLKCGVAMGKVRHFITLCSGKEKISEIAILNLILTTALMMASDRPRKGTSVPTM